MGVKSEGGEMMSKIFSPAYKLVVLLLVIFGCASGNSKVAVVYDGDTFELQNGEKVRLLGINTPEIGEPGADIAKDFLEKLVLGKEVRLEKDSVDRDEYKRLLRYVYVGDLFVNAELIRKGYAEVRFYPPNIRYKKDFESLEEVAYRNRKGLWAFPVFQPPEVAKAEKAERPSPPEENVISWKDADKYYGITMAVEGLIVHTYNSGKACFLNFHPDWKKYFQAVIFASDFDKFPPNPEDFYLNKKVRVTGLIKEYKGRSEIILKSPAQIKIIE